jgi:hypothetical protein
VPDDIATFIIVVRISVIIRIGRETDSDKRSPVKPVMKTVEATVERNAVEATSVEATVKSASVEPASMEAAAAVTAMSRRDGRPA